MSLTDEQWAFIRPLLPPPSPASRGRPPVDQRCVLDAILWKVRTSSPWYNLPPGFPSWQTCYRCYHRWHCQGILNAILAALGIDLRDRGGFDFQAALDARLIRLVPYHGQVHVILDSSFQDTLHEAWQLETVDLLLAVLFSNIQKNLRARHLRLASPVVLTDRPAPPSSLDIKPLL